MTYNKLCGILADNNINEAQNKAFILLEHIFKIKRSDLLLQPCRDYSDTILSAYIDKLIANLPIQYITGKAYFYGCEFVVDENCLIPRADTEVLCEEVIKLLPRRAHFLEFCTGSGCIPTVVLNNRPDVTCESIELFGKTVDIALKNRELNGIDPNRLTISQGDAFKFDIKNNQFKFDAIVSNPPYIPSKDISALSADVLCEPRAALDGGVDGMDFYTHFLKNCKPLLKPDGFFAFEIGFDQKNLITDLALSLGYACNIIYDLGKNPRVAIIR